MTTGCRWFQGIKFKLIGPPSQQDVIDACAKDAVRCVFIVCFFPALVKKGSPYSITERRVPELMPLLVCQPAGGVSHKPGGRLPLLSARPAVTPATLKRDATNFAAW